MSGGRLPSTRLSLTFLFDIPAIVTNPSSEAHDAACKKAAEETGIVSKDVVSAKAAACTDMTIGVAHGKDFDTTHHVTTGGPAVRFEFMYDPAAPKMALRVVTSLGEEPEMIIDGVTASRLAMHTMEVLEGKPLAMASPGNRKGQGMIPPFTYGLGQKLNFFLEIPGTLLRMLLANLSLLLDKLLGRPAPADPTVVTDAKSLLRFVQSERANDPAVSQLYCVPPSKGLAKPFRVFLALIETWRTSLSLAAYFFLINFSPMVAPAVSSNVDDITSAERRYKCAFDRPGPGPPPPLWAVSNFQMARLLFFNNYGIHVHNFSAVPTAFMWDWLELGAHMNGAGCISINGTFLAWVRGLPSALRRNELASKLGEPVGQVTQNMQWFKTMGLPASLAPKSK